MVNRAVFSAPEQDILHSARPSEPGVPDRKIHLREVGGYCFRRAFPILAANGFRDQMTDPSARPVVLHTDFPAACFPVEENADARGSPPRPHPVGEIFDIPGRLHSER